MGSSCKRSVRFLPPSWRSAAFIPSAFSLALASLPVHAANQPAPPSQPDGGLVLLGVLAVLAAGLWLQSSRSRYR